jgi:hypothetical protein
VTGQEDAPRHATLMFEADRCVQLAAEMREALAARDWPQAYACADWLRDLARDVRRATGSKNLAPLLDEQNRLSARGG